MMIHLLDGTYELFRHFYRQRRFNIYSGDMGTEIGETEAIP